MTTRYAAFAEFERDGWRRVAGLYESTLAGLTARFGDLLLDAVGIERGQRLLDVACGPGFVTAAAAARGASAMGLDFAPEMIRIAEKKFSGVEFRLGDAQELPFPRASFDRVVMNFGVLHLPDPDRAFTEARRVLRPGGRYGFTVWTSHDRNRGMGIVAEAAATHGAPPQGVPEGPDRLRFADEAECRRSLAAAGFDPAAIRFTTHDLTWVIPGGSFLLDTQRDAAVRTAAVLRQQTPEQMARIRRAVEAAVARYATPDGTGCAVPMAAHVITAAPAD